MKKSLLLLCLLTVWSATAIATTTSYDITAEQYERDDATTDLFAFNLTEIAAAAGFDSPAEMQEAMLSEHIFWGNDSIGGGELTNEYTHVSGGFYFSSDGYVAPKNEQDTRYFKPYFFCYFRADTIRNELVCRVGQLPDKCRAGDVFYTQVFLIHGGSTVEFNIELSIKENDQIIPTPTMQISQLDITGETDAHLSISRKYSAILKVGMRDIAEEFGVDMSAPHIIESMVYACRLNLKTIERTDELTGYNGEFKFKTEDSEEETVYPCAVLPSGDYSDSDCFTIYNLRYDLHSESLIALVYPNFGVTGEMYEGELYVVYGNKAHRINIHVQSTEYEPKKFEEYEYMGKSCISMELSPKEYYKTCDFDVNQITDNLGCKIPEFAILTLDDSNYVHGNFIPIPYYRTHNCSIKAIPYEGGVINYATRFHKEEEWVEMSLREMDGLPLDSSFIHHYPILFVHENKLYEVELVTTFTSGAMEFDDGTEVGSEDIHVQLLKRNNSNSISASLTIDYSKISKLTGTDKPEFFARKLLEDRPERTMLTSDFNHMTVSAYSGYYSRFYIDCDGYKIPDSVFYHKEPGTEYLNVSYEEKKNLLDFLLVNVTGEIYTGSLYFVNPETKKYYTINYTVEPVEEYKETEYVGEEDILLLLGNATAGRTELDMSKAMEALGIEDEDSIVRAEWQASRSDRSKFLYSNAGYDEAKGGFPFDMAGCLNAEGQSTAFHIGYVREGGRHCLVYSVENVPESGVEYTTRLALDYGGKRYVFHIRLMDEDTYVSVDKVNTERTPHDNLVYDLHGRIVGKGIQDAGKLARGIYILNGRKFVVR
ncbi:MAG: hypothetical protein NC206_07245 [Bacteroides sp.]|nr:hypothetical protein [Roseburia sp.]MCM1346866.1 hypothetical protein [Bacteroides sp.]MCM1421409.1 hypothetical protein [Bacteroides sp.]